MPMCCAALFYLIFVFEDTTLLSVSPIYHLKNGLKLPNMLLLTCEFDMLSDEAVRFGNECKRLNICKVTHKHYDWYPHGIITSSSLEKDSHLVLRYVVDHMTSLLRSDKQKRENN